MKKLVWFVTILVVLMSGMLSVMPVVAQGPDPCTDEQLKQWWIALIGLVDRYGQAVEQPSSLPAIATIQALRREYDAIEPPACALTPKPELVADMFNLRTDSMVLGMLGDAQADTLLAQADAAYQQVMQEIGDVSVPTPTPQVTGAVITSPATFTMTVIILLIVFVP